jgi:hypothetical protein
VRETSYPPTIHISNKAAKLMGGPGKTGSTPPSKPSIARVMIEMIINISIM